MWVCVCVSIQPCGRRAWRFGKFCSCLHQQRKCLHLVFITVYCTHTHTNTHSLLSSPICSLSLRKSAGSTGAHHNTLLLNLVGVPSTNIDLKEQDFLQLIVLGEWVEPFVLPEVICKKSILYCQNHLPSHPHFLP